MQSWLTIGSLIASTAPSSPSEHGARRHHQLVVVGVEFLGDEVGELEFVALPVADPLEADAERLQPVLAGVGQQRDDHAGVDAAGQQHPDRDVGDHPALRPRFAASRSIRSCQSFSDSPAYLSCRACCGDQ